MENLIQSCLPGLKANQYHKIPHRNEFSEIEFIHDMIESPMQIAKIWRKRSEIIYDKNLDDETIRPQLSIAEFLIFLPVSNQTLFTSWLF